MIALITIENIFFNLKSQETRYLSLPKSWDFFFTMRDLSKNYLTIQGWMVSDLKLSSNNLLVYALIFGFCQDENTEFKGSISYICDWLNCTRPTASKALDFLVTNNLIFKRTETINNVVFNRYKINLGVVKNLYGGSKEILQGGSKESLHNNNILDNNIYNNILLEKETKEEINFFENLSNWEDEELVKTEEEKRKKVAQKKEKEILEISNEFLPVWNKWKEYRKDKKMKNYAGPKWEQIALNKLIEISNNNPTIANEIVNQSIENNYQGLFPLKNNSYGNTTIQTNGNGNNQKPIKRSGRSILAERLINATKANGESGSTIIDAEICE